LNKKVKVEGSKTIYTHSYLYIAAQEALKDAKLTEAGRFYKLMAAELFSALCVEAYLNYFGTLKVPYWEKVERKLGPTEKLEIINHEIKLRPDFGKRPFQSFRVMFQFRNALAHGKIENLSVNEFQNIGKSHKPKLPETNWEALINLKTATEFTEDTKNMFDVIREKSGIKRNTLLVPSSASWVIRPLDINQK
jgi:hypothetical protein